MRLTDYLLHGPAMSTPPSERVRDVLTARHSKETALFSRTGFALIICIFVSMTSALPTFGHDILAVRKGEDIHFGGNPFDQETEDWQNYEDWSEFIETHPNPEYSHAKTHWHMHIEEDGIGGWDKCVAEAYYYDEDKHNTDEGDYDLVGGNCPDGTSTDPISPPPPETNVDPVFNGPATESVPENTPRTKVLVMVKATDDDRDDNPVTYSPLGGPDASHFSLEPSPGKPLERDLKFTIVPDYENPQDADENNDYVVEVIATSGTGDRERTTSKTITITVDDVDEPPDTPDAPSVLTESETSLRVSWVAQTYDDRPAIEDYDYRYEKTSAPPGDWTEVINTTIAESPVVIPNLDGDTQYYVQIRAENDEGESQWSDSRTGVTEANAAPEFSGNYDVDVPENTPTTQTVLTLVASDIDPDDNIERYEIVDGVDEDQFEIVSSNELRFKRAPNFEARPNNNYVVVVEATSGTGGREKTAKQTITVTVTDVDEPPNKPDPPSVSAESTTSLMVHWTEPTNEGRPPITGYNYRYKKTSDPDLEANWTEGTTTRLSVTISSLDENTEYEVQIQAKNDEGTSMWSDSGTGSTMDNNAPPVFSEETVRRTVDENTRFVLKVQASDEDEDPITYSTPGGADKDQFEIVSSDELMFKTAPDFENPKDLESANPSSRAGDNVYVVKVRATSGTPPLTADQTIIVTVTNVSESGDPVNPPINPPGTDPPETDGPSGTGGTSSGTLVPLPEDVTVSFTRARYEASEDDEAVKFRVRLSKVVSQEAVVDYVTVTGTAIGGTDYEGTVGTLTFPAGSRGRIIRVPIIDDKLVEEEETFTLRLSNSNATIGVGEATGAITDNDLQVVSVTTDQTKVEEGETVTFTLTRTGSNLTEPLRVPVRITERGDFLADGVPTSTRVRFAANETTTTLELETVDDEVEEAIGAVTATITDGDTYRTGDAASATVAIADNDGTETDIEVRQSDVTVSFAATRYQASEGGMVLDFAVRLSAISLEEVTVDYVTVSGTATAGQDYRATTGTLTFPILETEQRIRVFIIDDNVVEDDETFTVRLRNSNATIDQGKATGVIADDDLRVVVNVAADLTAVVEGGTVAFTLTRVGDLTAPLRVPVQVTELGAFLTDEVPTAATFAANAATTTLLVATDDDGHVEANGAVTATITNGAYQIGAAASSTVAVLDNDVRGVTVTPRALTVREGGSASYGVALNTEPTADVTVAMLVLENAEISVAPTALTFTAANWRTTQLVAVTADHDADTDADDPVTIRHAVSGGDYSAVTAPSVAVTILEDDPTIRIADGVASEDDGEMAFSVRLSLISRQTVTVDWTTADGTAIAGTDYEAATGTLTLPIGTTAQTIRVPIIDDDLDEAAETFTVALRNSNAEIADGEAKGIIADDDLPVVSVATDLAGVTEGETGAFTLTRVGDLTVPLKVPVRVTERGSFLAGRAPTEATFSANAATTTLLVATDDDRRDEANGSVTATITDGATHRVGDAASATVMVIDNDVPAVIVTPTALLVLEGGSANYTVVLDTEPTADVTVAVQVPEDAEVSVDETVLIFTAGDWDQAQTITVTAAQDLDAVPDDPVVLTHVVSGGNYDTATVASVAVTILEDDMSTLLIANAAAAESDGEMAFSVRLSLASDKTVTAEYVTASGTATAGEDYEATTGTLTFLALATQQTIRVPIIDDDLDEAAETFTVMLVNASNATIEDGKATGVIVDNDLPVVSVAADPTAVEEGATVTFTLTRAGDLTVPLKVLVNVTERGAFLVDGTPTEARFAVGASHTTLQVATLDDDVDEANGLVTATIAEGATHRAGDAVRAIVPVLDNDVRGATATPTALTIPEGGSASYTVVLTSEPTADVTLAVLVPDDAEVAVDETELTFTAEDWNQAQTITVTAAQDADAVADNPVAIRHAVSGGDYDAVTAASVAVTIVEDDTPTLWIADAAAAEGDGELAFQVRLSVASSQTVTVEYSTADGTATADEDYEATTGTLTFPALATQQTIRVPIIDDDLDEAVEAFTVALINASNATIEDGKATGVIVDNDLPVVSVTADPAAVEEGSTVTFTLTRAGDLTVPLKVLVNVTERGAFLAVGTPTEARFAVGASHTTLQVATLDDDVDEANGLVTATIAEGATHRAGDAVRAIVPVLDNDVRGATATPTALTIPEGGSASYTVVLTSEPTADVTLAVLVPDDAEVAVDETELTFTAEDWNQAQTITVTAAQDADAVADNPVAIRHAVSGGDYDAVTAASVAVTIVEDDTPTLWIADAAAAEGDGELAFQVRLSVASSQTVTVEYSTADGTATADEDYEATTGTLTFPALATQQTIRVPIIDDDLDEAVEAFTVALINASNATIGDGAADGVIVDNDLPVVSVTADPAAVEEGSTVTFTLTRVGDLSGPLTVPVDVTERGAFLADGTPTEARFDVDAATTTLLVLTDDDERDEADGAITATIAEGATHRVGEAASATVPVTDNDERGATVTPTSLTVDEGDSASYAVVLTSEPTADVTVAVQVPEGAEVAVDETELTFTAEDWNQAQTVTVTATQDADAVADDPLTVTHVVSGGDYDTVTAESVTVTITEDDTPELAVTDGAAAEGDEVLEFTVALNVASSQTVTVEYATADSTAMADTDYEETTGTLTFPALGTTQTIRVPIIDDDLDEAVEAFTVALGNASNATIGDGAATGIITDNDLPVVSVTADPTAVEEGGTVTFTLTRVGDLTVPLTVPINVTERGAFLAEGAPTEATFDVNAETTTLLVATDDDERDEADGAITATIAEGATHRVGEAASATVPVTDNDERGATVTPTSLTVDEGDSASYAVVLTSEPTADVTVAVQVPEGAEVAVDETELTFTAEDWNQAQTVTVTATQDADAVADDPLTVTHVVSGGDYDTVTAESVTVTITEDDTPELAVTDGAAAEGDEVLEFTVALNVASSQTVTVEYATADSTAMADTDYEETTGTLTFPALGTTQTIRVPIIDDDLDEAVEAFTVALGNASNATIGDGAATGIITDNDLPVVSVTADPTAVEEGGTVTFTLTRVGDLTVPLTVPINVTERGAFLAEGAPTEATFDVNAETTTLLVATDDDDLDEADGAVTATIAERATHRVGEAASATVPVTDNDERGATVTPTSLTVDEGDSASYAVVLTSEPTADVTVAVQVPEGAEVAVDETELTFTAEDWNQAQTVTVTATQDADAVADDPLTVTHVVSGGDYDTVTAESVTVTITEDDTPELAVTDGAAAEGDEVLEFTVALNVASSQTVTVEYATADSTAMADTDYEETTGTLTFPALGTTQTIRVLIIDDDLDEAVEAFTVALGNASNATIGDGAATGIITDNDLPVVSVTADPTAVEEGGTVTFTLTRVGDLTVPLTVPINVTERGAFLAEGAPTEATFDVNAETTTLLVATDDDDLDEADGAVTATIAERATHRVGEAASATVPVTDNDERGATVTPTSLTVDEGDSASYAVVLTSEPTADVTVAVQVPEGAEVAVDETELTFTAEDWNQAQTVTVTATQDADAVDDEPVTVTHVVSGGDYEGLSAAGIEVTITEDDSPGITVSETALTIIEGDSRSYTVVLDTEPAADVTVAVQVPEDAEVSVSPAALTFTAANWNEAQTVAVTAARDDDAVADDPLTLTHIVSGGDYEDVTAAEVEVAIIEDDTTGVTISITALEISEGDTGRYTIVLDTEPTADVTVAIQVPEDTDIAVSPLMLTLTADNWNTPQTVAVTAAQDDDAVTDDPVTITHIVSGGDYEEDVTAAGVEVTITEDDTAGVTISTDALEVSEGSSQSYTVVLDTEPAADVMVVVAVPEDAEVAVSPLTLTFTADNWNTPQTVAVTAAHDDDAIDDDPVTLTHAVSGGDYEGVAAAEVEVSIIEDDTPGVTVSETALTIPEGDSQSYMVVLDTEPAANVMVVVAVPEDAEVAVDETTLTFTAANWNTPQTVAVTAAHDDDAIDDDPVTLTHTVSGGDYEGVSASEVTVTITDDDTPALTIADANATEGDEQITFTVRLNVASSLEVMVDWTTTDGTATQGTDYAETTGTLRFDALETEQTITVPLLDDALDEADETFAIALSNAVNATLDDAEATGTIADNDDTPALTIADAEAAEGGGEITFAVTLGAVSGLEVTVDWTTADGTATADADYVAADGRLTFAPGQTEATIAVAVFNDALDEGDETLTIALSNPTNATIADGTSTGTITDDDPSVEKAWLARFGRTTAGQVMDAVSDRLTGRSGQGAHLTLGGQRVTAAAVAGRGEANAVGRTVPAKNASFADVLSQHPFYHLTRSSFADIISRSSFQVSSAKSSEEQGARWTAWGRGATTRFRGEEVDLSLTGGAVTGLLGGDWQRGRMLAGLAVAHSSGTGEFDVHTAEEPFRKGELGTYLTSVHPYLRVAVTERLSAWGLFGYGRGQMERMGDRPDTDIGMQMGGLGARGALLSPTTSSDFDVALKSDAFLVRMDTDAAVRPALETMTSRLRLLLEGSRIVKLSTGLMSPSIEVGMRHDGGDAETGLGLEVGGGLGYTNSERGLALKAEARRLLVHQDNGYEEWGVGGSVNLDPGALGRGPSLRMQSSWGASGSGMDRLWSQRSTADLARSAHAAGAGLFDAELGYGLDALGGLLTPYAHVASSGQGTRTYGLGGRLQVERSLRVELVGERRERTAAQSGHALKLRSTLYW